MYKKINKLTLNYDVYELQVINGGKFTINNMLQTYGWSNYQVPKGQMLSIVIDSIWFMEM